MPSRRITFVLPFNKSDNKEGYNSDFKNSFKLKEEDKLDLNLNKEILLFKDNPNLDLKPKEGTSFINIKEYLAEIALIEPLELPPIKIPDIPSQPLILSAKLYSGYYNNRTRIQALTLL
jgi:hypothetical protein